MASYKDLFMPKNQKQAKAIKAKWVGRDLIDDNGNVVMQAPSLLDAVSTINSFMPVTGDIQAGYEAVQDAKKGDYLSAGLNSIGLLPFVPALGGIVKNKGLQDLAKNKFGMTRSPSETGFILDDGSRLDFSGRHEASGYKNIGGRYIPDNPKLGDYLKGERATDHRTVSEIMPNGQYGWDSLAGFIDQTGAVRYMPETGISLVDTNMPSEAQIKRIVSDFKASGDPLIIDIDRMKDGQNLASKDFDNPNYDDVYKWIKENYKDVEGLLGGGNK